MRALYVEGVSGRFQVDKQFRRSVTRMFPIGTGALLAEQPRDIALWSEGSEIAYPFSGADIFDGNSQSVFNGEG